MRFFRLETQRQHKPTEEKCPALGQNSPSADMPAVRPASTHNVATYNVAMSKGAMSNAAMSNGAMSNGAMSRTARRIQER